MSVINQVLVLFFLILIGYCARRAKAMDDGAVTQLSGFVLNITLPCLILAAMQRPFSGELLGEAGAALGLSLGIYAFAFALALIYPNLIGLKSKERGVHRYALIFSNVGYMGYPVVEAILGPSALFHLAIYNIPFNLFAFSVGAWIVAKDGGRRVKLSWRTFANLPVLATLGGFVFFVASIRFSEPLYRALDMAGDATTPISMIVIGAILAKMDAKRILGKPRNYITILFRLVLIPALTGAVLYALGVRGTLFSLSVLIAAMPVAASVSIMAELYDGDGEGASALVFVSTLLSMATIPLVVLALPR